MFILNSVTQSGLCTNLLFPQYTSCVFFPLMCSCLWRSPKYVFLLPPNHVPETENMLVIVCISGYPYCRYYITTTVQKLVPMSEVQFEYIQERGRLWWRYVPWSSGMPGQLLPYWEQYKEPRLWRNPTDDKTWRWEGQIKGLCNNEYEYFRS